MLKAPWGSVTTAGAQYIPHRGLCGLTLKHLPLCDIVASSRVHGTQRPGRSCRGGRIPVTQLLFGCDDDTDLVPAAVVPQFPSAASAAGWECPLAPSASSPSASRCGGEQKLRARYKATRGTCPLGRGLPHGSSPRVGRRAIWREAREIQNSQRAAVSTWRATRPRCAHQPHVILPLTHCRAPRSSATLAWQPKPAISEVRFSSVRRQ